MKPLPSIVIIVCRLPVKTSGYMCLYAAKINIFLDLDQGSAQGPGLEFGKPVRVEDYRLVPADLVPGGTSLCFSHDDDLSSWGETAPRQG